MSTNTRTELSPDGGQRRASVPLAFFHKSKGGERAARATSGRPGRVPLGVHPLGCQARGDTLKRGHQAWRALVGVMAAVLVVVLGAAETVPAAETKAEVKNLTFNGGLEDGKARLVIEALLGGLPADRDKLLFATTLRHAVSVRDEKLAHTFNATFDILHGEPKELALTIGGPGEIKSVTGAVVQDWSVRQETNGTRSLVIRPRKTSPATPAAPHAPIAVTITAEQTLRTLAQPVALLTLTPPQPTLFNGYLRIDAPPTLAVQPEKPAGLVPLETALLPDDLRGGATTDDNEPLAFRFSGASYSLPLRIAPADPEDRRVVLRDFALAGQIADQTATFTLTATARVKNPQGGALDLLSGGVALTGPVASPDFRLRYDARGYGLVFDRAGEFPVRLQFQAAVRQTNGWSTVDFRVAPAALQRVALAGLPAGTQFRFADAARPERVGAEFVSHLPAGGAVNLAWLAARPEAEGKLFYAAEMLAQIRVSPGLMRQEAALEFKVMQGELSAVTLRVRGEGEITRVAGEQVLAWNVERVAGSADRRLVVRFNQPQKSAFTLQLLTQTPLGAFPQQAAVLRVQPEDATRFAGFFRIVNDGAVRLEVLEASGLSQVSPEQFPQTGLTRAFPPGSGQKFAYRFSGAEFALKLQADQILPELSASQVLAYHLGANELALDAEIELDIREAPLRELLLRVPRGYALARLAAAGMADSFLREPPGEADAELRLVFGQPVSGRQVIQLRLERNAALGAEQWVLPRLEVVKARSVRGNVGVSADAGFRLTPARTQGLTEIAPAFFPRKVAGLQSAFRISEPGWEATLAVERLPQTVQADVFHLFSIGEGIAYGSSVISYVVSGAPVSAFRVELSDEYFNVEFTGADVRNWQRTTNGWLVQLHAPVAGAYTLLAAYERPFKPQGETLGFTGARPLDAQTEQGHTLVISANQFSVKPAAVSPGLLALETGEVPPEYRLFFDAPILAAYRYTARPFELRLALSPLAQGDSLNQVVDRASLVTRVSKEGQVLTDATYFVKSRGNQYFRLALPEGTQLWSATVNGASVVPVTDARENLIRLPQQADPNALLRVELKLASRSANPERVTVAAPRVNAPLMLAEWKLRPDVGQRLEFRQGTLAPTGGLGDASGFAALATALGETDKRALLLAAALFLALGVGVWRWTSGPAVFKFSARHWCGVLVGGAAVVLGFAALLTLAAQLTRHTQVRPGEVTFLAPVQQAASELSVEVANVKADAATSGVLARGWPVLLAVVVWVYGWIARRGVCLPLGWTLLAWAALRAPNGAPAGVLVAAAFVLLHVVVPALRALWRLPRRPAAPMNVSDAGGGAAPAVVSLLLGGMMWFGASEVVRAEVTFPLTPALSPGEREKLRPPVAWADDLELGEPSARGIEAGMPPWSSQRDALFPLPAGEGQGEGERSDNPQRRPLLLAQATRSSATDAGSASARRPIALPPLAESVLQNVRVEDGFVLATAKVRWTAEAGQLLPLVFDPAVVTRVNFPEGKLKLVQAPADDGSATRTRPARQLLALAAGAFTIEVEYQLAVARRGEESGFTLATQFGLVNELQLTLAGLDVDVLAPQAVAVQRAARGTNTVATLALTPANGAWIGWRPRSRDVARERAIFYAEWSQLYVPSAGVIEGVHHVAIRPAQGEVGELVFTVPPGATITDVNSSGVHEAAVTTPTSRNAKSAANLDVLKSMQADALLSLWRFDPDTRKLRVTLAAPQSRPFALVIRSQVSTGPLPFAQKVGLLAVEGAAGQIGLLGLGTGNDVQFDAVDAPAFSPINLEDFPATTVPWLLPQFPGLTVRRAFRHADPAVTATLKASAVEADVRVEAQQTLSLGEDRTVLAANLTVDIARAGIFRLSFVLPEGLDVEAISGAALSHWTELKSGDGRVITLNLRGKTEGRQQFTVSLAGPGVKSAAAWTVPRLSLREAGKQQGTLVIAPEQGMQLQPTTLEGLSQLDPQRSGIRQKGVLAFRLLQSAWNLVLRLEQVDPWIQVTSLQHATVNEALVKVAANLQYQIENTGLKSLHVLLPTNAESVRFTGELVADFLPVAGAVTNGMQPWEVKLQRRVLGAFLLQANYQTALAAQATDAAVRGVLADGVNLQRGFVTVQAGGRLQVRVETPPAALQPTEWQGIPRALQQNLPATAASFAFRLVEPAFELPLKIERHEAAKLLPARVNQVVFTSVIADDGVMLTQARLELLPGDKRLLHFTLPKDARFWFAFVNQNGVWPWREGDRILLPLEQPARPGQTVPVEIFYTSRVGAAGRRALDLALAAPQFDLPLEDITWRVFLNDKWELSRWSGALQLQQEQLARGATLDLQSYLTSEASWQRGKTQQAEQMLNLGNSLLEKGDPQQARRAFQQAYGLSQGDLAFNEDARVQLNNLKVQQALVGLNVRQAGQGGPGGPGVPGDELAGKLQELRTRTDNGYSQQDAKAIIERNSTESNAAFMRLAQRLIQQQDAAVNNPAVIRANIPEQGRLLTFKRAVLVDTWADLSLALEAQAAHSASWGLRALMLLGAFALLATLAHLGRRWSTTALRGERT